MRMLSVNLPIRGRGTIFLDLILYMVLYIATTRNLEMQKRPINCMGEKRIPNLIKLQISNNLNFFFHFYNFSVDDLDVMFVNRLLYLEDKRHILNVSNTELDLADQDYRFEDVIKDDKTLDMLEDAFNQISLWAKNRRIVQNLLIFSVSIQFHYFF